jgi:hypothetical protein
VWRSVDEEIYEICKIYEVYEVYEMLCGGLGMAEMKK